MSELTQEKLKKLLSYDPETGIFIWKKKTKLRAEKDYVAGSIDRHGYVCISFNKKRYAAHRLAWLYMKGYTPKNIGIDHIDRDKINNKFDNLRLSGQQCNSRNTGNFKSNTSGVKGVYLNKSNGKWYALIKVNKELVNLGHYVNFDDAVLARYRGERLLGWSGCDSCSPAYKYVQKMLGK